MKGNQSIMSNEDTVGTCPEIDRSTVDRLTLLSKSSTMRKGGTQARYVNVT